MSSKTLIVYRHNKEKESLIDWIESITDITIKARVKNRIRRIELGNIGDYRSLLLLCGGDKHSQENDVLRARALLDDYKYRYEQTKNI